MKERLFEYYGEKDAYSVIYNEDTMHKVMEVIFNYMQKNNCFHGESLHQDDDCIIYAPDVLSEIIDDILIPKYLGTDE